MTCHEVFLLDARSRLNVACHSLQQTRVPQWTSTQLSCSCVLLVICSLSISKHLKKLLRTHTTAAT
jgi:predicted CxxxxCH...CXXCH cytochrome family protein